eukprot:TCONS_00012023-protein
MANMQFVLIFLVTCVTMCWSLSDGDLDKIKKLVDKELITREAELLKTQGQKLQKKETEEEPAPVKTNIKIHPDQGNEPYHPLGPKATPKPLTVAPKATQKSISKAERKTQKPTTTTTATTTTTEHPDTNLQHSIDNCIDIYDSHKCRTLIKDGMSCEKDDMEILCERSCGFCGQLGFPVDCMKTKFGCCDDALTPKTDPWGDNCPVCKDNVPALCEPHVRDCNEIGMVGNWMRTNCKKTCDVCKVQPKGNGKGKYRPPCKDDDTMGQFCEGWKDSGLCRALPNLMDEHCRKTCGRCDAMPASGISNGFNYQNLKKST